ncbi:hypothetical protein J2X76_005994 [Neorhizobium sp. 2083]|uniref:hypothetical protein n=1 Tax=Neorhizobium sp. 2083 TaxID=2817762 RepID=UPI00285D2727|nr:hypothetical protein [Neorhizobium sp. 2083]MDR6820794.1 hypothetical protein [Neorhizobium sp. 2083]
MNANKTTVPRSNLPPERQSVLIEQTLKEYAAKQESFYSAARSVRGFKIGSEAAFGGLALYGAGAVALATAPVALPVAAVVAGAGVALSLDVLADTTEEAARVQGRLYHLEYSVSAPKFRAVNRSLEKGGSDGEHTF